MRFGHIWGKAPERLVDGRAPYPLSAHMLDTFIVTGALWDTWLSPRLRRLLADEMCSGDETLARRWVALTAGLHDIGKATPVFQLQAASTRPGVDAWRPLMAGRLDEMGLAPCSELQRDALKAGGGRTARRHEYLGLVALSATDPEDLASLRLSTDWLAATVGGHHGHWHLPGFDDSSPDLARDMCSGRWSEAQTDLVTLCVGIAKCDLREAPRLDPGRAGVVITLLTGLTILADWVASSDQVVDGGYGLLDAGVKANSPQWLDARAAELEETVRVTIGSFQPPQDPTRAVLLDDDRRSLRPLQLDAGRVGDGAWFVAYPTGEGKTEAALLRHLAGDVEGLIFGMPTRATTNEMQGRLAAVFAGSGNSAVLSHQYAVVHHVECASTYGLDWYSSSIRRLVAPLVAATCDQILIGALPQKHAALRLLALANHHVVLDEVHTYDHYQSHLLKTLLAWWGATGTRVTLLSATMPQWKRRELANAYARKDVAHPDAAAYPAHWRVDDAVRDESQPGLSASQPDLCTTLGFSDDAGARHVSWAVNARSSHPRCHIAVIRSTVDDAVLTARKLQAALPGAVVTCLHSRMTVAHRARVESMLEARLGPAAEPGPPVIVVATQVIEAALDYDFDLMSTDLAPAASLIQRAGRLWRFRDGGRRRDRFGEMPKDRALNVVARTRNAEIAGGVSLPYFDAELTRVAQWLAGTSRLRVPDDVQRFVDETSLDLQQVADLANAEEIASASRRIAAATQSVSSLQQVAGLSKRCRYANLNQLTGVGEDDCSLRDEDRMGTRFDELVSGTYLLLGGPAGMCSTAVALQSSDHRADVVNALRATVPATGARLCAALDEASAETVGGKWEPRSRLLAHTRPIDIDRLAEHDLTYDDELGLIATNNPGARA